eukprot:gene8014-8840_t
MLAPRKKLWSTPKEVLEAALLLLHPQVEDIVYDIGCGEGNFLFLCASTTPAQRVIGIEIETSRIKIAQQVIADYPQCEVIEGNALEYDNYSLGNCFFLYLIPRGLKLILPILLQQVNNRRRHHNHNPNPNPIRIVTYMSPLPNLTPKEIVKVKTLAHDGAAWPLFYYEVMPGTSTAGTGTDLCPLLSSSPPPCSDPLLLSSPSLSENNTLDTLA